MNQQIHFTAQEDATVSEPESHRFCIMCGSDNPLSFGLRFAKDGPEAILTEFQGNDSLQGYEGLMHGGILSALLDTAMAHCLMYQGVEAFTGELNVRYRQPVPCNSLLTIRAWIDSSLPPLYQLRSTIHVDGKLVCKAKAKFMERRNNG